MAGGSPVTGGTVAPLDVLVVGAGPAGLVTALQARAHGAAVRVVERREQPFRPSRAMILHPRTLEGLRPLDVTDDILARGDTSPAADLHLGRRTVHAQLGRLDLPDTAFPHLTMVRQTDVEEVLRAALHDRGVEVEWGTELLDVTSSPDSATGTTWGPAGTEQVVAGFVAGCDGPASTVRDRSGIGWRGGAYREEVLLADLEIEGLSPGRLHVVAAREGLVFLFAQGELAPWRLLATRVARDDRDVDPRFGQTGEPVPETVVRRVLASSGLGVSGGEVAWSSTVPLQHRLADAFRAGRVFLAGDAAHAHSPAAAQGMNTGILDAVNLGWKLALACRRPDEDHEVLLDSYEQERRPVARQVLALTHAVFFAEASTNPLPALLRGTLVPLAAPALPLLLRQRRLMAVVANLLSQRWVRYRHSPLSVDGSPQAHGWPRPGDRLPDEPVEYDGRTARLHDLTAAPGVHLLLERDAVLPRDTESDLVTPHRLTDRPGRGVVAVRPDGYVGLRCGDTDPARLGGWLDLVGAR